LIRFSGANYNTGLVHVTTSGTVTTGTNAQGKTSGTLYWKIPAGISGTYGYLCASHGAMIGTITVKDISAI
jgi:plastocyanin